MTNALVFATAVATWDSDFRRWAKPLSDTEEAMADRAASVIRDALKSHPALENRNVEVYATGSYRNNTNVRGESDIDVAAVCHDSMFYDCPPPWTAQTFGITTPATYSFAQFRQDVQDALRARFGTGMTPGDKAINVHENTYRLEADVTPFFEYRRYKITPENTYISEEGVKSIATTGVPFTNWHHDHYKQGVARNLATGRRFKRITRILKNVKFDMMGSGTASAKAAAEKVPSFLVECLVFNAPVECFDLTHQGYVKDVRSVLTNLWERTKPEGNWNDMVEVSWRKWLFRDGQTWSREVVNTFLAEAWGHLFA